MSNAFVFADCFNTAKEILAKPQMSEKVLIDLLLHLDGKSAEEVKQIVKDLVEKVDKETGETMTKIVDGVLSSSAVLHTRVVEEAAKVEKVVDDIEKVVDEVTRVVDVVKKSKWWCCK
jgi:DNA-binding Lrp family transcriptional regulator